MIHARLHDSLDSSRECQWPNMVQINHRFGCHSRLRGCGGDIFYLGVLALSLTAMGRSYDAAFELP